MSDVSTYCNVSLLDLKPATRQLFAAFARAAAGEMQIDGKPVDADGVRGWVVKFGPLPLNITMCEVWPFGSQDVAAQSPTLAEVAGPPAPASTCADEVAGPPAPASTCADEVAELSRLLVQAEQFKRTVLGFCQELSTDLDDIWPATAEQKIEVARLRIAAFAMARVQGIARSMGAWDSTVTRKLAGLPARPTVADYVARLLRELGINPKGN